MSDVLNISSDDFKSKVVEEKKPVLVDFWAPWCGPCKAIAPLIDEISQDYQDKITVVKVNVDQSSDIASEYGVRGIPTLLLFKNGNVSGSMVGAVTKDKIKEFLDQHVD